jgi:hypothetical protein
VVRKTAQSNAADGLVARACARKTSSGAKIVTEEFFFCFV